MALFHQNLHGSLPDRHRKVSDVFPEISFYILHLFCDYSILSFSQYYLNISELSKMRIFICNYTQIQDFWFTYNCVNYINQSERIPALGNFVTREKAAYNGSTE